MSDVRNHYIAKVFARKDGDTTRRVVSFDRRVKNEETGEWSTVLPRKIEWEDGHVVEFHGGPATYKLLQEPRGNHIGNIYVTEFRDSKKDDDDPIPF